MLNGLIHSHSLERQFEPESPITLQICLISMVSAPSSGTVHEARSLASSLTHNGSDSSTMHPCNSITKVTRLDEAHVHVRPIWAADTVEATNIPSHYRRLRSHHHHSHRTSAVIGHETLLLTSRLSRDYPVRDLEQLAHVALASSRPPNGHTRAATRHACCPGRRLLPATEGP